MAAVNELFDIRQPHLVGKIILSSVSKGRIVSIDVPDDSSVITVTASDLVEKNIRVFNDFIPVLADNYVHHLGQPVMAVFGPDSETVDMFCSKVNINIDTDDDIKNKTFDAPVVPFTWTSGNLAKFFTPEAKIVESEFTVESQSISLSSNERIIANFADDVCHIKLSSQWPIHVKDSVANVLGLQRQQVQVYIKTFRADYDQLLILPSLCAAITATAARKSNSLVELFVPATSWQPETHFKRQTVLNNDGKPVAEKVFVEADFGAYPLFVEEAYYNILCGLIPAYEINATEVHIQIIKSTRAPASFFGDLGYSTAVAFTENHYTRIARSLNKSPYEWRAENLNKVSLIGEKVRRCMSFESLKQTLEDCAQDSWFNRKYSVFSQNRFVNQKVSAIAGYANGIGIACSYGVGGFSEKFPFNGHHHVSLVLSEDGKVFVTLGFFIPNDAVDIYKALIAERLNVERDKIYFTPLNADNVPDFGPNVLSRSVCVVPKLLDSACSQIEKRLAQGAKAPLVQQIYYPVEPDRPLFDANTFGSISIALHIDPVKVVPVIDNVTARLKFGKVYDTTILARRIRQTICTTISRLCPCIENNYNVDLKVKSNPHLPAGSCSSMLSGITSAAFASAVSQALGHEVDCFPINERDVIAIVQMKNNTEEEHED